ncbi:hypothetical protein ACQ4WP_00415 [Janthinobacterium sp. GB4P2]|uniref:hypothetical protein n=1 Tax=Janthinobacterium sp. GB4P2 TaxID=3424189 RepID=UPI003F206945
MQKVHGTEAISAPIQLDQATAIVGLMTLEKFAEAVGLPPGVVLGHLNRGILPTVTLGRRRLINVVALQRELSRKEFVL